MSTLKKQRADGTWEFVTTENDKLIQHEVDNNLKFTELDDRLDSISISTSTYQSENDLSKYKKSVTSSDVNGNPTEVYYSRKNDNTIAIKRNASNPDTNGFYQTVIEQFYNVDGITVYKTVNYSFTFLENGIINTSDGGVIT